MGKGYVIDFGTGPLMGICELVSRYAERDGLSVEDEASKLLDHESYERWKAELSSATGPKKRKEAVSE